MAHQEVRASAVVRLTRGSKRTTRSEGHRQQQAFSAARAISTPQGSGRVLMPIMEARDRRIDHARPRQRRLGHALADRRARRHGVVHELVLDDGVEVAGPRHAGGGAAEGGTMVAQPEQAIPGR